MKKRKEIKKLMEVIRKEKKAVSKQQMLVIFYIAISAIFALPSVLYMIQNHSIYRFIYMYSYTFKQVGSSYEYLFNAFLFMSLWIALSLLYYLLLKYHSMIFKNIKQLFLFVSVVGLFFVMIIPCTSSDVYSYIANRLGG